MTDIVLIDQYTNQGPVDENTRESRFYVRLSVERSSEVDFSVYRPLNLVVDESFGNGMVSCKLTMDDIPGSIVNVKPIEGDFLFTLTLGPTPDQTTSYRLKLANITFETTSPGDSSNYAVVLHLVSDYWDEMALKRVSRGWRNKKYSEVVQQIADECGIEYSYIPETRDTVSNIISPYWTNHQLLKWIAPRCTTRGGDTFFVFAPSADNGFIFCPFSDLMNDPLPEALEYEVVDPRAFILSGYAPDEDRLNLMDFKVDVGYSDRLKRGASGVKWGYYDFDSRSYVRGDSKFSESNESQLSDWAFLSENHESGGHHLYGHREERTPHIAKSLVSRTVNQIQQVTGRINGTTDIRVGERVNLLIPINPEFIDIIFNEFYAGDYIVSRKRSILDLDVNRATTVFQFSREGINGTDVNTLVESTVGRV